MTFRGRLVIAATVAVAIAVLLAAGGAFYFSRNALINSLDGQLANTAQSIIGPPNANPVIDGPRPTATASRSPTPAGASWPAPATSPCRHRPGPRRRRRRRCPVLHLGDRRR